MKRSLLIVIVLFAVTPLVAQYGLQNYVYFNLDRDQIRQPWFADSKLFSGAQLKYRWAELEPEKGKYSFDEIREDLQFLTNKDKRLFIQIQDVSFDPAIINVPKYLLGGEEYNGGADLQYFFSDDEDNKPVKAGWVSRRWDMSVAERFGALLDALGKEFDGKIEGVTLPETAVDFGSTGKYYPKGFTPEIYRNAILEYMKRAKHAFPKSQVIQYANFMPGEWLPWDDKGYLKSVFEQGMKLGIGLGGPDVIPYKKAQMNHSYKFANEYLGKIVVGYAVQEGNYSQKNAKTGKVMTIADIYEFAASYLNAKYIFWYPEKPYFEKEVIPYLYSIKK